MFPAPNPQAGLALRRQELPFGLELISVTLTGHEFPPHVHEGYTIGLVADGAVEFWSGGRVRVCPAGSLILLNPGEVHTGRAQLHLGPARYRIMYPKAAMIERVVGRAPRLSIVESADRELAAAFERAALLAGRRHDQSAETSLAQALSIVIGRLAPDQIEPGACRRDELIRTMQAHLTANLHRTPSLVELGTTLGFHPGYLRRVFRAATGLSPRSYLVQLRVMRARQLLGRGCSISTAVAAGGFTDQSHLTREFRRVMGYPPGRFQSHLRASETAA